MMRRVYLLLLICSVLAGCRLKEEAPGEIPPPADVAAPPADAIRTKSGLAFKVLQIGFSNVRPSERSLVRVHYTGWTTDGKMFESSVARGAPIQGTVGDFIKGWGEGLQLMVVGEKRRFWIPGDLAYDNLGMPGAPKGMLVFDVELLEVR
jgi:peptidylprolyl isomerase